MINDWSSVAKIVNEISEKYLLEQEQVFYELKQAIAKCYGGVGSAIVWEDMTITVALLTQNKLRFKNYVVSKKMEREIYRLWEARLQEVSKSLFARKINDRFAYAKILESKVNSVMFELFYRRKDGFVKIPNSIGFLALHSPKKGRLVPSGLVFSNDKLYLVRVNSVREAAGNPLVFNLQMFDKWFCLRLADEAIQQHMDLVKLKYSLRVNTINLEKRVVVFHSDLRASASFTKRLENIFAQYDLQVRVSLAPNASKWRD